MLSFILRLLDDLKPYFKDFIHSNTLSYWWYSQFDDSAYRITCSCSNSAASPLKPQSNPPLVGPFFSSPHPCTLSRDWASLLSYRTLLSLPACAAASKGPEWKMRILYQSQFRGRIHSGKNLVSTRKYQFNRWKTIRSSHRCLYIPWDLYMQPRNGF